MIKYNLHTHSKYCRHGVGEVRDYVEEGKRIGLDLLGFSDHLPYPDDAYSEDKGRMFFSDFENYIRDVKKEKERDDIKILLGFECDWIPGRESWVKEVSERSEYLIFGLHNVLDSDGTLYLPFHPEHWAPKALFAYGKLFQEAAETGLFLFAAHPDLFMNPSPSFGAEEKALSKDIISIAKENNLILEVNGSGIDKSLRKGLPFSLYPRREFWEMVADEGLWCIRSTDSHEPNSLERRIKLADDFSLSLGLRMVEPVVENGKIVLKKGTEK